VSEEFMSGKQTDFDILMNYNVDIRGRTLYLDDAIDEDSASLFIKTLRYLDKTSGDINIIMNCYGGCVSNGFAMFDAIKACSSDVTIKVYGSVMSMATIVFQAADHRIMGANARMMIHRGEIALNDHVSNVKNAIKESDSLETKMMDIYLEKIHEANPDFKKNKLKNMMDFDTYMSADEALELGLIDEIEGEN
jgi:ATP-dependent Clp protease protease subunit